MEFFIGEPALKTQRPHQSLMRRLWCGKPHRQKFVLGAAARTAIGASSSLPHVPAKACILIAERALSLGGGNASSCPKPAIGRIADPTEHQN